MGSHDDDCAGGNACRAAVLSAYRGFRACGGDDPSAFRVALQVLTLRHPERPRNECILLASEWIAEALENEEGVGAARS